ncbi:hypothetical protein ACSQ67_004502 [Phaseolus vulgaris]
MSWRKMGIWGLVNCLLGNAGPFASGDWILPDLTIQGSTRLNYPMLFIKVLQMSQWDEDWQDNDGALNTISMTHPLLPVEHPNCLVEKESDCKPLHPVSGP